jgi:hypothetical protein
MRILVAIAATGVLVVAGFTQNQNSGTLTTPASTQPTADIEPTTQPIDQLRNNVDQLQKQVVLSVRAANAARTAVIGRLSQTPEYQRAEAAVTDAQTELDAADPGDARAKAATDKLNAKAALAHLEENAFASDRAVTDALKSIAEASAQLKIAQARLDKAQADEAAAEVQAEADSERAQKLIVLSAHDFDSLPYFKKTTPPPPGVYYSHGPMEFTPSSIKMNGVGYVGSANVFCILDDSTAIVQISLMDPMTGTPYSINYGSDITKPLIIEGVSTDGLADDTAWPLNRWFKIVGTKKSDDGTTYLVAWQIVEADKTHPVPTSAGN